MRVMKEITFDAAHQLRGYDGNCANLHGHQWRVQVIAEGPVCANTGMVIDFKALKQIMKEEIEDRYDHKYINEVSPFDKINPTAENIAGVILGHLTARNKTIIGVRIWETPTSCAEMIWE